MSRELRGRPTKLTPENQEIIIECIQSGCTYKLAAQAAGMSYHCFNEYMKKGEAQQDEENQDEFYNFYYAVKKAEALRAKLWLDQIGLAALDPKNWTAAAWKLERCHRESYSRDAAEISEFIEMFKEFQLHLGKGKPNGEEALKAQESNDSSPGL